MKKLIFLLLTVLLAVSLCACGEKETTKESDRLSVVATLFPQYDFAREITRGLADVTLLLPPGTDSHAFDPSISDVMKMADADVFIYTGKTMESWAVNFLEAADDACLVIDVSKNLVLSGIEHDEDEAEEEEEHEHEGHIHTADPHVWTSPVNAQVIVETILAGLCEKDPANAAAYTANAESYLDSLRELDGDFRTLFESHPGRKLYFGGRFAFHYFTEEYDVPYLSLYESCSESAEPSVKRLTALIDDMNECGAKAIFYPELTDSRSAENIAAKTNAGACLLHSCHNLSQEEMDAGKTYLSLMRDNYETIKEALS